MGCFLVFEFNKLYFFMKYGKNYFASFRPLYGNCNSPSERKIVWFTALGGKQLLINGLVSFLTICLKIESPSIFALVSILSQPNSLFKVSLLS